MPKEHYAVLPQMPKEDVPGFFITGKKISNGLLRSLRVEGTSLFVANGLVAGQKAQHFMLHIIPRVPDDNLLNILPKKLDGVKELYPILINKLSEMLGEKKETVAASKEKEIPAEPEEKQQEKSGEVPEKSEDAAKPAKEVPADEAEEPEPETKEENSDKEKEVDLDDIARLFG